MQRAPIVIASTLVGTALVLGYHPHASGSTGSSSTALMSASADASTTSNSSPADTTASTAAESSPTTTTTTTTAAAATKARVATGSTIEINENGRSYGQIAIRATVDSSGKLTTADVVTLDTYDGRSQQIASYAVPQLLQESVDAGSAQIDGISGATYTSQAYATSLQAALDKLGV